MSATVEHVIGENTAEEMALPASERPVKVGTVVQFRAMELIFVLDDFAGRLLESYDAHLERLHEGWIQDFETVGYAKDFVVETIRKKWMEDEKQAMEKAVQEMKEEMAP